MASYLFPVARGIPRRIALAVIIAAVGLGAVLSGAPTARAQLVNSLTTSTTVVQGGTVTMAVTSPAGAMITAVSSIPCTTGTTLPAASVTYSCNSVGGLPAGTVVQQTFSVPAGPISETVTYNANGPAAASLGAAAAPGTLPSCSGPAPNWTCFITLVATVPGGTLTVTMTPVAAQTVVATVPAGSINGCPATTPFPAAASASAVTTTYTCGAGQTIGAGQIFVNVTTAGAATAPTITATTNANSPTGFPAIPAATAQSVTVAGAPTTATITGLDPTFGSGGTPVTITGTNLTGVTAINFSGVPGGSVTCNPAGTTCGVIAPPLINGTVASVVVVTAAGPSSAASITIGVNPGGPIIGPGGPTFSFGPPGPPSGIGFGGVTIPFQSGWNLVSGGNGGSIAGVSGPMYTFQAGDSAYEIVNPGVPLVPGRGYWAFFPTSGTITLPLIPPQPQTVPMPPLSWIMVGNPSSSPMRLLGADVAYTYNPVSSYQPATVLDPGQGAWVLSLGGGTLTITP
jgi:hypothetical protein